MLWQSCSLGLVRFRNTDHLVRGQEKIMFCLTGTNMAADCHISLKKSVVDLKAAKCPYVSLKGAVV